MENIKKYKVFYILAGIIIVLICIIICFVIDNKEAKQDEDYNYLQIAEENNTEDKNNISENSKEDEIIYIHISGEVANPGVLTLHQGDRIKDAIEKAGGLTENADIQKINLAFQLSDGQKVNIPNINDKDNNEENSKEENYIIEDDGENIIVSGKSSEQESKVNINTATQSELETLTGIGPSTASKIIEYRNTNGMFKTIDEIKNVSGIGDAKYKNIENDIVVK